MGIPASIRARVVALMHAAVIPARETNSYWCANKEKQAQHTSICLYDFHKDVYLGAGVQVREDGSLEGLLNEQADFCALPARPCA